MWIYENTKNNSARFVLGERGERPLICFGINSSTAKPEKLDRTVRRVQSIAKQGKFDGWTMLNLYPQRATKPEDIHQELNVSLHKKNLQHIKKVFQNNPQATIWAAWGGLIESRIFLKQCLKDIIETVEPYSAKWVHKGELLAQGHPHHPLYLRNDTPFLSFNINSYLKNFNK
jgi:hypothetical protein